MAIVRIELGRVCAGRAVLTATSGAAGAASQSLQPSLPSTVSVECPLQRLRAVGYCLLPSTTDACAGLCAAATCTSLQLPFQLQRPKEDVAHFLFQCPLYTTLRTHFADLFPPSISTPQAGAGWPVGPACARTAQYLSQCYELHSHTLLPPPSPMRPAGSLWTLNGID